MITVKTSKNKADGDAPSLERLQECFKLLNEPARRSLLHFAEYLTNQEDCCEETRASSLERQAIPRPSDESVVQAIRRLAATYPMIDRSSMLNETSTLMASHVMQGRPAVEVIDELEVLFQERYEQVQQGKT